VNKDVTIFLYKLIALLYFINQLEATVHDENIFRIKIDILDFKEKITIKVVEPEFLNELICSCRINS
jgi:hypothetical protein